MWKEGAPFKILNFHGSFQFKSGVARKSIRSGFKNVSDRKGNAGSAAGIKLVTREYQQARKTGRFARNYDPTTDSADLFSRFPLCPSEVSPQNRHRTGKLIPDQVEQRERHLSKDWGVEQ